MRDESQRPKKLSALRGILYIVGLVLMPGIRGYNNWLLWEYLLFVVTPIGAIIYIWIRQRRTTQSAS